MDDPPRDTNSAGLVGPPSVCTGRLIPVGLMDLRLLVAVGVATVFAVVVVGLGSQQGSTISFPSSSNIDSRRLEVLDLVTW